MSGSADPVNTAIIDYYRCPRHLVNFQLCGDLSEVPGYFSFGQDAICYGNLSSGFPSKQVINRLYDASLDTDPDGDSVRLPFDPDEIICNLRFERYRDNGKENGSGAGDGVMLRNLYYSWLRPFFPVPIRKYLQRMVLSDWGKIAFPRWPVDGTVERILDRLLVLSMKAQGVERMPFIWFWPAGARSCVIMTHDVDHVAGRD